MKNASANDVPPAPPDPRRWLPALTLAYVGLAWIAGVYLGSLFDAPIFAVAAGLLPLAAMPFLGKSHRPALAVASLCLLATLGAMARTGAAAARPDTSSIGQYNGTGMVELHGLVSQEPDISKGAARVILSSQTIGTPTGWAGASGKVLITMRPYPDYHKGDLLDISGKLEEPPSASAYGSYLSHQGIVSLMDYPAITLEERPGNAQSISLEGARSRLTRAISLALPEPQASLGAGILLGERAGIPDYLNSAFSRTGTMHLLAVSGMNLTIVAGILLFVTLRLLGRRRFLYVWVAVAGVWGYAMLTGAYAPVLRAAVMASVFLIAEFFGRQKSAIVAIIVAAAAMVGVAPQTLWDVSFQLSFVSMLGLMLVTPSLLARGQSLTDRLEEHRVIQRCADFVVGSFAVTLGAMLATWPLLAYYFGTISTVSLLANLAIVPVLPAIMVTTSLAALAGLVTSAAAWVSGWAAWPFLTYMIDVVRLFDRFPQAAWRIGPVPAWTIVAYYGVLAALLWFWHSAASRRNPRRALEARTAVRVPVRFAPAASVLLLGAAWFVWSAVAGLPDGKLHVSFLNVGNGDAALISTPQGRHILIDGGPDPQALDEQLAARLPLLDRDIDLVVLSHPHADHLTGLLGVLGSYHVRQVLEAGEDYDSAAYREWQQLLARERIPVWSASTDQSIELEEGMRISVLHAGQPDTADLDQSVVMLRVEWRNASFLFTSDAGEETERGLLEQRAQVESTVLKVGHHGSSTSTSAEFLAVARPQVAVVSVGANNEYGQPSPQVMQRLSGAAGTMVLTTAERGAIDVATDGERIWVKAER